MKEIDAEHSELRFNVYWDLKLRKSFVVIAFKSNVPNTLKLIFLASVCRSYSLLWKWLNYRH